MRRSVASVVFLSLAACGGLENAPLTVGVVQGTMSGATADSLVSVVGLPQLSAKPDAAGAFRIADVPVGEVELLLLVNQSSAERRRVTVTGGGVADVGVVTGQPATKLEVELRPPDNLSARLGTVTLVGTAARETPEERPGEPYEVHFFLPPGCYQVRGEVPGLLPVEEEVCLAVGDPEEDRHLDFKSPDGSAGQEGCALSGCVPGGVCQADGRCRL
ncbi:MAG: hypothetical protein AB1938_13775 [Myxococcota bacterium]